MATKIALALLFGCTLVGCAPSNDEQTDYLDPRLRHLSDVDPYAMPPDLRAFIARNKWGALHLEWHTERRWDLLSPDSLRWAQGKGYVRNKVQEGGIGNGLQFLAMHRGMLGMLRDQAGANQAEVHLFDGWAVPPEDPHDPTDPLPSGGDDPFDPKMHEAIQKLMSDEGLKSFDSDDTFGRYLETNMRPTKGNPRARSTDPSTGLHNYLHVRFTDDNSPINVGDPSVNLNNKLFWRLHGWIDARWTHYRELKGKNDATDVAFNKAIKDQMNWMMRHPNPRALEFAPNEQPPQSLIQDLLAP
jgi:hypothetical protein